MQGQGSAPSNKGQSYVALACFLWPTLRPAPYRTHNIQTCLFADRCSGLLELFRLGKTGAYHGACSGTGDKYALCLDQSIPV